MPSQRKEARKLVTELLKKRGEQKDLEFLKRQHERRLARWQSIEFTREMKNQPRQTQSSKKFDLVVVGGANTDYLIRSKKLPRRLLITFICG